MSREIQIFGVGFSEDDANAAVEVSVDGTLLYEGEVPSEKNAKLSAFLEGSEIGDFKIASWVEDNEETARSLEIKATSGNFLYTETLTTFIDEESFENPELEGVYFYNEDDGDVVADPNSNILLDGVPYEDLPPENRDEMFGQWSLGVPEGSTLTCDLYISAGKENPKIEDTEESSE